MHTLYPTSGPGKTGKWFLYLITNLLIILCISSPLFSVADPGMGAGACSLPQGPCALPRGPCALPRGPCALPRGPCALPRGQCALPQGPCALPQGPRLSRTTNFHKVFLQNSKSFPNICCILEILLVIPVTTANVERANSSLKYMKTDLRSNLSECSGAIVCPQRHTNSRAVCCG
jgi:hypothetical protein